MGLVEYGVVDKLIELVNVNSNVVKIWGILVLMVMDKKLVYNVEICVEIFGNM